MQVLWARELRASLTDPWLKIQGRSVSKLFNIVFSVFSIVLSTYHKQEIEEGQGKMGRDGNREKGIRKEVKREGKLRKGEKKKGKTVDLVVELTTFPKWFKKLKGINSSHRDLM